MILQGFKQDRDFELARQHLLRFPIYSLYSPDSYIQAAQLYRKFRQQGITIRKTIDYLIAQTAIENKLAILHDDNDFNRIAGVCPLKIYHKKIRMHP